MIEGAAEIAVNRFGWARARRPQRGGERSAGWLKIQLNSARARLFLGLAELAEALAQFFAKRQERRELKSRIKARRARSLQHAKTLPDSAKLSRSSARR